MNGEQTTPSVRIESGRCGCRPAARVFAWWEEVASPAGKPGKPPGEAPIYRPPVEHEPGLSTDQRAQGLPAHLLCCGQPRWAKGPRRPRLHHLAYTIGLLHSQVPRLYTNVLDLVREAQSVCQCCKRPCTTVNLLFPAYPEVKKSL